MDFLSSLPTVQWDNLSSHIKPRVQTHLLHVYSHLTQMLLLSSLSAYASLNYDLPLVSEPWISLLGTLVCFCKFLFLFAVFIDIYQ